MDNNNNDNEDVTLNGSKPSFSNARNARQAVSRQARKVANKVGNEIKKKAEKKAKQGKVWKFILAHIGPIAIVVLILLAIIFFIGIILFFITMPGMILGKIDDWGREILGNVQGLFTGDSTSAKISKQEILSLGEHLERMGYDIQAYGLGTVEYEDDDKTSSTRNGKGKVIKEITENVEGKEYLRSYIAANENTYVLSQYSILGFFSSATNNIKEFFTDGDFKTNQDYSTGMIDIVGYQDDFFRTENSTFASIDRNSKQLKIYSSAINLGPFGTIKRIFTNNPNIQWGEAFSYDLNNWVGRYGRPTELSLALHLSTMMPDLPYEIATSQDFNTKVKIGLMDTSVVYEVSATKGDSTIDNDKINEYYSNYCSGGITGKENELIPNTKWTKLEIAELAEISQNGQGNLPQVGATTTMPFSSVMQDNGNFTTYALSDYQLAQLTYVAYREQGTDAGAAAEASLMANLFESGRGRGFGSGANGLVNYVMNSGWFASRSTGSTDNNESHKNIVRQVLVNGKRTLPIYVDEHDCLSDLSYVSNTSIGNRNGYIKDVTVIHNVYGSTYTFYEFPGGANSGTDPFGYTSKHGSDFCYKFDELSEDSGGIRIKWPFIAEVTNHWFYNDIDFTKGVYRFAKGATKQIDYKPDDEDDVLNKNKVSVKLDATLGSNQGIIYQVADPETSGPNEKIKELFTKEYYKYDGTLETSRKIENSRAVDSKKSTYTFNGEKWNTNKSEKVEKEKVDFKENKTESLAAFGILENMHTEASDYIYRNLKELMISLKYFTTQELTEDLQNMMLWPIKTDNQNTTWELSKDEKEFGTVIKCSENEKTVVAPSEAKVEKIEGNTITLEFINMSDESYELLKYIYDSKDPYKKINKELVTGMKLKIKDIQIDSSIKAGETVKRSQKLGTAIGKKDGSASVTILMYNLDKSIVEDLSTYYRQEDNTKYEELMKAKKEAEKDYADLEGLDISELINQGALGSSTEGGSATSTTATGWRAKVVEAAKSRLNKGITYSWGYDGTGYDWNSCLTCSGLAWGAYKQAGIDIPRGQNYSRNGTSSQIYWVRSKGNWHDASAWKSLQPGDLVFFGSSWTNTGHVAVYIGNDQVIDSVPQTNGPRQAPLNHSSLIGGGSPI